MGFEKEVNSMKITNNNIPVINNNQPKINKKDISNVSNNKRFDEVMNKTSNENNKSENISKKVTVQDLQNNNKLANQALKMKEIHSYIKNSSDIRTDKVEEIKAKIANGTYNVSAEELADKLINSGLVDSLLKTL